MSSHVIKFTLPDPKIRMMTHDDVSMLSYLLFSSSVLGWGAFGAVYLGKGPTFNDVIVAS